MTSPTNAPANAPGSRDPKKNASDAKSPSASAPAKQADSAAPSDATSPVKSAEVHAPSVGSDPKPAAIAVTAASPVATQNQGVDPTKADSGRPSVLSTQGVVASTVSESSRSPVATSTPSLHAGPRDPKPVVPADPAQPIRSAPVQAANESQPAAGAGAGAGDSTG